MARNFLFTVPDITCVVCIESIEKALKKNKEFGEITCSGDPLVKTVLVTVADESTDQTQVVTRLKQIMADAGFDECELQPDFHASLPEQNKAVTRDVVPVKNFSSTASEKNALALSKKKRTVRTHLIKGLIGLFFGVALMALMLSGLQLPMIAMYALVGFSSLFTLFLGREFYFDAIKKLLRSKQLNMNALFTVSTLTVIAVSVASFFVQGLPMMLDAGLLIFGFRHIGIAIEESLKQEVSAGMVFTDRAAQQVLRFNAQNQAWELCDSNRLQPGDLIQIQSQETLPVDGILEGEAWLETALVNGAVSPTMMCAGGQVCAGMRAPSTPQDPIKIKVTQSTQNSYLSRLDRAMTGIYKKEDSPEKNSAGILQYFVLFVFALAIITGAVVSIYFGVNLAIYCALSVVTSACPCILGFIIPLAVKIGVAKGMENGVVFKNSEAIQRADNIDVVVLDLNGTLTTGVAVISQHQIVYGAIAIDEFYSVIKAMEKGSKHSIGHLLYQYVEDKVQGDITLDNIDTSKHSGVQANWNGNEYLIGNKDFLNDAGVQIPDELLPKKDCLGQRIYLCKNKNVVAFLEIEDPLKPEAKFVVDELKRMQKDVYICTGADQDSALNYAQRLGIAAENVFAAHKAAGDEANDKSKVKLIRELQQSKKKRVAMIGDAGNDAPATKQSNFGITVQSGAVDPMTQQYAGALIHQTSLLPVLTVFAVARRTVRSIRQNLAASLAYNMTMLLIAGGILLTVGFALNPGIGVALMVLQMTLILLNQYRIKRQELPFTKRYQTSSLDGGSGDKQSSHLVMSGLGLKAKQGHFIDVSTHSGVTPLPGNDENNLNPALADGDSKPAPGQPGDFVLI